MYSEHYDFTLEDMIDDDVRICELCGNELNEDQKTLCDDCYHRYDEV